MEDDTEDSDSNSTPTPESSATVGSSNPVVTLKRLDLQRYLLSYI